MKQITIKPNILGKYTVMIGAELLGDNFENIQESVVALHDRIVPKKTRGKRNASK